MVGRSSSDRTSRRRFLQVATAVGAGGFAAGCTSLSPVGPAAAISTGFNPADVSVDVTDGRISEFGLAAIWYELEWEAITGSLQVYHSINVREDGLDQNRIGTAILDVPESGSDTWGYGSQYEDQFDNELTAEDFIDDEHADSDEPPLSTTDEEWLEWFEVDEEGESITIEAELELEVLHYTGDGLPDTLSFTMEPFNVTVHWLESEGEVIAGAAQPFGED